jgi:hypothetical protein
MMSRPSMSGMTAVVAAAAAVVMVSAAQATEEARYPNWKGAWAR